MLPKAAMADASDPPIHPTARLEEDVRVEPGAVIGREAQIGRGTVIAAGALVGYRVSIGRGGYVGPGCSVMHALVGDRVILLLSRPGRIVEEYPISIERPRRLDSFDVAEQARTITDRLKDEVRRHGR